ncbi:radical SAM protein (plasmid) [Sphingobium sp. SCG-1]|uniref:radical SAM protein n=1 Tax=Sphingobium sp. SCG-1 TaxID=2072936 RepID=UPI000CD6A169|nr:radical SAM protein [Sphingobium sp. SCG-1]AUW60505.1 radical SAM protein [Sphingobium sp. SCG-1]
MANKNILLIEPGYKNKYPPLGLMKIAQYHGPHGKKDRVRFIKGNDRSVLKQAWDRIYVTTLFSFEYPKISETIDFAIEASNGQPDKVFVGGIAASLMHERFLEERRWHGARFIQGLLSDAPALALQLDAFSEEFYADDVAGEPIENLVPDYGILEQIEYRYPVRDAYFAYCSRGCIRKCHFCGVPKLEGALRDTESLTALVQSIDRLYGPKKDLILMDNNVVASAKFKDIIAEIRDLGFVPGAKLLREGARTPVQRRVDFNQGVDARILCKDPMYLRELATICLKPLRIAFDHLGVKKPYEQAVRYAAEYGLTELSNYMLYNFHDNPADLFERMRLNVTLNEELGVRVWSFPMRYQPTNRPDRGHIGEKWTRYQLRSLQIVLQATHGVVSGEPAFFRRAFGDTFAEFESILTLPHDFIFNRDWYEEYDGRHRLGEFREAFARLDAAERAELLQLLSSCDPRDFVRLPGQATSRAVARILPFYVPVPKAELLDIWAKRKAYAATPIDIGIPDDERVEDAGLDYDEDIVVRDVMNERAAA